MTELKRRRVMQPRQGDKEVSWRYIGQRVTRGDGPDKVTGHFDYLADQGLEKALFAVVLMSPHAHAEVTNFDDSKALAAYPETLILRASDLSDKKYNSGQWFWGQEDHPDETLLTDHPRHVGDRVALVLAKDELTARRACALIDVEYRIHRPVLTKKDAVEQAEFFHDDGLAGFDYSHSFGNVEQAFTKAHRIFTSTITTPKIHHAALETHAVAAIPRPEGVLEVRSPCQILFGVQQCIAQVVPLPLSKIRVIKSPMGGTFGGKQEVVYEALCAYAAYKLNRPVFLNTNRTETMLGTRTRAAVRGTVSTALDAEGRILARTYDVDLDAGAYVTGAKKALIAMFKKASRLYRIPAMRCSGTVYRTSTTPSGACRGYGSPQIHALSEIHTDQLCTALGLDPVAFRLNNLVEPGDKDPAGSSDLGQANIKECLIKGAERFRWTERAVPTADGRFRRAAGFACCTHGNGYYGTVYHDSVGMSLRLFEDGSAVLRTPMHEMGNGTVDALALIVGEELGLDLDKVVVTEGDSQFTNYDIGCQASRVIFVCGECARRCTRKAVNELEEQLTHLKHQQARYRNGQVTYADGTVQTLSEAVTELIAKQGKPVDVMEQYIPQVNPASYGCHFADVTVDTLTGLVRVNDYLAVHDIGQSINRAFVEGQIYGGVQMGLGMGLMEELAYDSEGRPSARNLDKYHLYNSTEMPPVEVLLVENGEPGGPYGAKSIGEIATVPVAPAVVNAVNRALGTDLSVLPLTPARISRALAERENCDK